MATLERQIQQFGMYITWKQLRPGGTPEALKHVILRVLDQQLAVMLSKVGKMFTVASDASERGIGTVLMNRDGDCQGDAAYRRVQESNHTSGRFHSFSDIVTDFHGRSGATQQTKNLFILPFIQSAVAVISERYASTWMTHIFDTASWETLNYVQCINYPLRYRSNQA
ncbi:hypothetical protein CLF_106384 [Clonorchis sinensis]|uniref:Uncharacterized protein n=1 Tax=Clonorchis sinensis TaxID=79923 RepID=G7YF30_CLOSI|nr:hypothetical protein CLF_106384 [Clonorchis sinensis]